MVSPSLRQNMLDAVTIGTHANIASLLTWTENLTEQTSGKAKQGRRATPGSYGLLLWLFGIYSAWPSLKMNPEPDVQPV